MFGGMRYGTGERVLGSMLIICNTTKWSKVALLYRIRRKDSASYAGFEFPAYVLKDCIHVSHDTIGVTHC